MMRGRVRNDEDFGQAASAAIGRNTDDLAQLVGALFGAPAADQFRDLWANHVTALFNYSSGLATDDAGTRDRARAELVRPDRQGRPARVFLAVPEPGHRQPWRDARPGERGGHLRVGPGPDSVGFQKSA